MNPASKVGSRLGVGRLLRALESPTIVRRVSVQGDTLMTEPADWADFWRPVRDLGVPEIDGKTHALREAWHTYITSGFDAALQCSYREAYHALIVAVIEWRHRDEEHALYRMACQRCAAFECFPFSAGAAEQALVAGTTTLRNPSYLIAKSRRPRALDDSRLLPLVTVPENREGDLFYNYRQYRLSTDCSLALLLYPAVPLEMRSNSFELIGRIARQIGRGADPRVAQRARRLAHKLLLPLLVERCAEGSRSAVEIVDVGAGTGALAAALCEHLVRSPLVSARFRLQLVDLELARPSRFFAGPNLRRATDSVTSWRDDYRRWLSRTGRDLPAAGVRIAVLSKVLNNLSQFSLDTCRTHVLSSHQGEPLVYYEALRVAVGRAGKIRDPGVVTVPTRILDPACLCDDSGESIVRRLLDFCHYVIIEDADLKPGDLRRHGRQLSQGSMAIDLSRALRMVANHVYLIARSGEPVPPLGGSRLW